MVGIDWILGIFQRAKLSTALGFLVLMCCIFSTAFSDKNCVNLDSHRESQTVLQNIRRNDCDEMNNYTSTLFCSYLMDV